MLYIHIRNLFVFLSWKRKSEATQSDVSSCGKEPETEKRAPEPDRLVFQEKKVNQNQKLLSVFLT